MRLWCDEQISVSVDGPGGRYEVIVPTPWARIGAHPQSDVALSGPAVAKRAFYLHATSAGLYALSLDLQNIDLKERGRWLLPGDVLTVGEYRMTACLASGLTTRSGLAPLVERGSVQPPLPVLNIHCGGLLKDKRRFRSRLSLLGRRPQCSLQLKGAQVSSFHCALYWEQRRLWCIDLLSSNGTRRNGDPLDCEELLLHDRLGVGEFELEYHRWSPRRSMVPGWDPASDEQASEEAPSSADALSDVAPVTGANQAATESSVIDAAEVPNSKAGLHFAEEVARLASERREMQEQWSAAAERLASEIGALQIEAQKLSQERESLETARTQWQIERLAMVQELANRNGHLARLETDLAAATTMLQQRLAQAELQTESARHGKPPENASALPTSPPVPETPGSMPATVALDSDPSAESQTYAVASGMQHDVGLIVTSTDISSPLESGLESNSNPAGQREPLAAIPVGRRGKAGRDEMSAFVRDRLRDIESTKRRKSLMLWATIGAAALTISAVIWGALVWLY